MATLTLSEKEKNLPFVDFDDDSLGRATKAVALILSDSEGKKAVKFTGAATFLISHLLDKDDSVEQGTLTVEGLSLRGQPLGDWEIVATRIG